MTMTQTKLTFIKKGRGADCEAVCGGWCLYSLGMGKSFTTGKPAWIVHSGQNTMNCKEFRTLSDAKRAVREHFATWVEQAHIKLKTVGVRADQ